MRLFRKPTALHSLLKKERSEKKTIGFVPTMGSLHEGHASLISRSKLENDITVVSIYVNPRQFNNQDDFLNYPKSIKKDLFLLKELDCDIVFCPKNRDMQKGGEEEINIDCKNLDLVLEAEKRPGHFNGVIFIVHKLFKITIPDRAYFGEKDYQQLLIVRQLTKKHFKALNIISCPTIRDSDGLAKSSRNQKLTPNQLQLAKKIFTLLNFAAKSITQNKIKEGKRVVKEFFNTQEKVTLDYFEVIEEKSFGIVNELEKTKTYRMMIAFEIGKIRLIDNLKIKQ
tara:strand:+ start:812 stop:1660 length:849 start_codon:yes stop_codon:yes gene_type:complete